MGKNRIFLFLLALVSSTLFAEVFGTYEGILRHHSIQRDQLAKIDFVARRKDGNSLKISATLKLFFGSRNSQEYVSYYFEEVTYDLLTSRILFHHDGQGVSVLVTEFDGKKLTGTLQAPFLDAETPVSVFLSREKAVEPMLPLIDAVAGKYIADNGTLELLTYRSTEEDADLSSPYRQNQLIGRLARVNEDLGSHQVNDNTISGGVYDFFRNRLILFGSLETLTCAIEESALKCDGEKFARQSATSKASNNDESAPPSWKKIVDEDSAFPKGIKELFGQYRGYVHNESRNAFQVAGLSVFGFPKDDTTIEMYANASLSFGEIAKGEGLYYKFQPQAYVIGTTEIVFSQPGYDAVIKITSTDKGLIRGIWYSKRYGRVGTFEMTKEKLPTLPEKALVLQSLSGSRTAGMWQLQLTVAPQGLSTAAANPFAPLGFAGLFLDVNKIVIPKSVIRGGSYDFFTGRIFIPFSLGGENLYLIGNADRNGELDLMFHLSNRFGDSYQPQLVKFGRLP